MGHILGYIPPVVPWESHLASLNLSFLTCRMGLMITYTTQSSWEDYMKQGMPRPWQSAWLQGRVHRWWDIIINIMINTPEFPQSEHTLWKDLLTHSYNKHWLSARQYCWVLWTQQWMKKMQALPSPRASSGVTPPPVKHKRFSILSPNLVTNVQWRKWRWLQSHCRQHLKWPGKPAPHFPFFNLNH